MVSWACIREMALWWRVRAQLKWWECGESDHKMARDLLPQCWSDGSAMQPAPSLDTARPPRTCFYEMRRSQVNNVEAQTKHVCVCVRPPASMPVTWHCSSDLPFSPPFSSPFFVSGFGIPPWFDHMDHRGPSFWELGEWIRLLPFDAADTGLINRSAAVPHLRQYSQRNEQNCGKILETNNCAHHLWNGRINNAVHREQVKMSVKSVNSLKSHRHVMFTRWEFKRC